MSLENFVISIKNRGKELPEEVNKVVRQVALVASTELIISTPVDTGRARSNWQVGVGEPVFNAREPFVPGVAGSTISENTQQAINEASKKIQTRKPEATIYINNNLPYIGRLNEGYSAQAPAGFVEAALKKAVAAIRKTKVLK